MAAAGSADIRQVGEKNMFGKKTKNGKESRASQKNTRKYGTAVRPKHSTMGKNSCRLAAAALILLLAAIGTAFWMRGKTAGFVGGLGILSIVCAGLGIRAAVKGFRERERNYITCRIGLFINGLMLLGLGIIFFGGLF